MLTKEIVIAAIEGAIAKTGKYKGQLKAKCPPMNTPAAAAWTAMMLHVNPYKVSVVQIFFLSAEYKEIHTAIDDGMDKLKPQQFIGLDKDRLALEAMGVW